MAYDIYQTGNPMSGAWRYPYGGATSSDTFNYKPAGIDPEFLKKVAGGATEPKGGLLQEMVKPTPLEGLLRGDTGYEPGDGGGGASAQAQSETGGLSSSQMSQASPGSLSASFDGKKGAMGMMSAGIPGLLAGVTLQQQAPVFDVMMPGLNGFGFADQNYGSSPNAMGAPNAEQANALAAALANALAGYAQTGSDGGGMLGDSGLGSAGNAGNDGAGGIGSW